MSSLSQEVLSAADQLTQMAQKASELGQMLQMAEAAQHSMVSPFLVGVTVFALACFVGYYVVWRVTPALHSPLMAVTNAVSSVIIVGAILAAGLATDGMARMLGLLAVALASVNIFGGFIVTQRMLEMFKKKAK
ncbi:MAG: NAD(P) transhydrogenase subunit alpha [Alphaproteobacteria bacterium]|nr:MAG: NAD(P) transhydrogenase subunit alpha [Alphaproteobacteria bacterium]